LRERDIFIKDTREHNTFCFYAEQTRDKILAYAVELTGIEKGRVTGNLYELDYQKHYEHVKDASVDHGNTKLIYENGERTQEAEKRITGDADPDLGKFLSFEEQPKNPAALPYMETEIQELVGRTAEKLKKLTEEEFAGLVFLPAEDME